MNDSNNESQNTPPEPRDIRDSIIEIEKRLLKLASIQTVLSVAAVFTGVIALFAALTESHAVRKQTAGSVWPYVQTVIQDTINEESAYIKISLNNVGVGPAKMQGLLFNYKGQEISDWASFVRQFEKDATLGVDYGKSDVRDRVLAPEESLLIFQTHKYDLAQSFQNAIAEGELSLSYCYCSIFDECWLKPFPDAAGLQETQPVKQCPSYTDISVL